MMDFSLHKPVKKYFYLIFTCLPFYHAMCSSHQNAIWPRRWGGGVVEWFINSLHKIEDCIHVTVDYCENSSINHVLVETYTRLMPCLSINCGIGITRITVI